MIVSRGQDLLQMSYD